MIPRHPQLDSDLETFLEFRRAPRSIPADVRARVVARSRASMSGLHLIVPPVLFEGPTSRPPLLSSARALFPLAVAASIAGVIGVAGAFTALRGRAFDVPPMASPASPLPARAAARGQAMPISKAPTSTTVRHRSAVIRSHLTASDPSAEVELLQRAQLAYARLDFSSALAIVAEHARRFPKGPLAEECEALRVESLVGSGRVDEARRAGVTFAARFPRSVLLPRIEDASHGAE
jgi:hypothetical protein